MSRALDQSPKARRQRSRKGQIHVGRHAVRRPAGSQRARGPDDGDIRCGPKRKRKKNSQEERGLTEPGNQEKSKSESTTTTDRCTTRAVGQTKTKPRDVHERTSGSKEREAVKLLMPHQAPPLKAAPWETWKKHGGGDGVSTSTTDGHT